MTEKSTKWKLDQLLHHLDGAYAPNTLRAYKADMIEFIIHCEKKPNVLCRQPQKQLLIF